LIDRRFTQEAESYIVQVFCLNEYRGPTRKLPDDFAFLDPLRRDSVRAQERQLLRLIFDDWILPYDGRLPGFRVDSPILVMHGDRLVGGAFLCDRSEFPNEFVGGQVHYPFINSKFRGSGIYSAIFSQAVERAREWNLNEFCINTDRYGLPQVYARWGAKQWRVIQKSSHLPQSRLWRVFQPLYPTLRQLRRRLRLILDNWIGG
jgi:GNAT superfamily N-acetyltransferase